MAAGYDKPVISAAPWPVRNDLVQQCPRVLPVGRCSPDLHHLQVRKHRGSRYPDPRQAVLVEIPGCMAADLVQAANIVPGRC
jgi:hypothetical protein